MDYTPLPYEISKQLLISLLQSIPELLQDVAQEGFAHSELVKVYHPTPEQQYREYRFIQLRTIQLQRSMKKKVVVEPTKSFDEFLQEIKAEPIREQYEIASIFGNCIWDIFSNNHTVFNRQFESYDLGSARGSGGFVADVINELSLIPDYTFDYIDFYMGHSIGKNRSDLTGVYAFIFQKLKDRNLGWEYSFPRIGIINLQKGEEKTVDPAKYDPDHAMKEQLKNTEKENEVNRLHDELDRIYEKECEKARYEKPDQEVMAYFKIYHHWPPGHPLSENE
ncbi:MAG TPA: hypothetical protein VKA08_12250 [Balneolales bacterium]|nr:hypothetical protein [Balneolales bacterium]